jgi:hypothetical protein
MTVADFRTKPAEHDSQTSVPPLASGGKTLDISMLQFNPEAWPRQVRPEFTANRHWCSIEEHALYANVVMKVFQVAQICVGFSSQTTAQIQSLIHGTTLKRGCSKQQAVAGPTTFRLPGIELNLQIKQQIWLLKPSDERSMTKSQNRLLPF